MSDQAVGEVLERLDALAAKLGVTAEQLWGVLLKQAMVEIVETMAFFVATVGAVYLTRVLFVKARKTDDDGFIFGTIVSGFVSLILLVGSIFEFFYLPTLLLNPEYWALQQILKAAGGL